MSIGEIVLDGSSGDATEAKIKGLCVSNDEQLYTFNFQNKGWEGDFSRIRIKKLVRKNPPLTV